MRSNLAWLWVAVLVGLLSLAGGSRAGEDPGKGILSGRVTRGPLSPVQGPGLPAATAPAPGVKLLIYGPERQEIAAVTTDARGEFRINLPPGAYLVELAPAEGKGFSKDLPAPVSLTPGRETRLNLRLDTGIR